MAADELTRGQSLRGALIGFGVIAGGHAWGIAAVPGVDVVAVVDPVVERRAAAARAIAGVATYATVEELPADLDFIAICTPPKFHFDYIAYGLRAGLGVLCEKPLVTSQADLDAIAALVDSTDGFLMPCHNYRYAPSLREMTSVLSAGRGSDDPVTAHFRTLRTRHARGVVDWNPDWRRLEDFAGGGILWDHGPHSIYLALTVTEAKPTRVRCNIRRPSHGEFTDSEEFAFATVEFDDNSSVQLELDWNSTIRQTSYLVTGSWGHCRVIDDSLEWACTGEVGLRQIESDFNDPTHRAWFAGVWRQFVMAYTDHSIADRELQDAMTTVRVINACYRSAEIGGAPVEIAPNVTQPQYLETSR